MGWRRRGARRAKRDRLTKTRDGHTLRRRRQSPAVANCRHSIDNCQLRTVACNMVLVAMQVVRRRAYGRSEVMRTRRQVAVLVVFLLSLLLK
jgi:hypothetical protein